jgi:hypothetical protein
MSAGLALRTIVRRAACLRDAPDSRTTPRTGLAFPIVDAEPALERLAVARPCSAPATQHDAYRIHECPAPGRTELRCGRARTDARFPERFGCVDVAETCDHTLIEQHRLDRSAPALQRGFQPFCIECLREWIGTEADVRTVAGGEDPDRRQCTWIDERYATPITKRNRGPGVTRQRVVASSEVPIAGHSEVNVQRTTVVEHDALVLGLLFDSSDRVPPERRDVSIGDQALKGRMQQLDADDLAAKRHASKAPSGSLDFGKLRHVDASRATGD